MIESCIYVSGKCAFDIVIVCKVNNWIYMEYPKGNIDWILSFSPNIVNSASNRTGQNLEMTLPAASECLLDSVIRGSGTGLEVITVPFNVGWLADNIPIFGCMAFLNYPESLLWLKAAETIGRSCPRVPTSSFVNFLRKFSWNSLLSLSSGSAILRVWTSPYTKCLEWYLFPEQTNTVDDL